MPMPSQYGTDGYVVGILDSSVAEHYARDQKVRV